MILKKDSFRLLFLSLFLLLLTHQSQAENNKTVSLGYYQMTYSEPGLSLKPTMIGLHGNYRVWDGFSLEGRLAYALDTDLYVDGDNETEFDISLITGAYLKYNLQLLERISPYVFAGVSYGEFEITETQINGIASLNNNAGKVDSSSFGVGIDTKLSDKFFIGLEYVNYYEKDSVKVSATALNLSYKF